MKIHLLSGFLGSGKTTAIQQAATMLLKNGIRTGVITNDQGIKLVDAAFFDSLDVPSRQVGNGCFCCNYNELDKAITSLAETKNPEIIFAESVGSCTDLVATIMRPLLQLSEDTKFTISTFTDARLLQMLLSGKPTAFDDTVVYIFFKQLEEAGIIVVNKVDMPDAGDLENLSRMMQSRYPDKKVIFQNSLDPVDILRWVEVLDLSTGIFPATHLDIDYDIYGAGEGKLAWLDQELEITTASGTAFKDAIALVNLIFTTINSKQYPIGHLKFLLNKKTKISFTSAFDSLSNVALEDNLLSADLLINARVETRPTLLSELVAAAIKNVARESGCTIKVKSIASFQPGYPRPTHRITG